MLTASLGEMGSSREYGRAVYIRGCAMYHALCGYMGEENFFAALRRYYEENLWKIAKPADLFAAFSAVQGRDMEPMFAAWYYGTAREQNAPSTAVPGVGAQYGR